MTDNVAMPSDGESSDALTSALMDTDEPLGLVECDPPTKGSESQSPPVSPRIGRFRHWRRSRPFWGGLLALLAGLEIAAIPLSAYKIILVATSVSVATVTGVIIAVLGLVTWLSPSQSKLYGLLTVVFGVVSFVTSNIGGFVVGGLLAIVGGALIFAWDAGPAAISVPRHSVESSADPVEASVAEQPAAVVPLVDPMAAEPTSTDLAAGPDDTSAQPE
jgi:Family of unknown function (DUF6114)